MTFALDVHYFLVPTFASPTPSIWLVRSLTDLSLNNKSRFGRTGVEKESGSA